MRLAFGLDLNKCTGCHSCQIACKNENDLPSGTGWRQVVVFNRQKIPQLPVLSYSMACNHCVDPPCAKNCPALAYDINDYTGAVTIDGGKCMGCKYCQWVCPYDAPSYNASAGVMTKCTLCSHLMDEEPACVNACPTGALSICEYREENGGIDRVPDIWRANIKPALMVEPVREEILVPHYSETHDQNWLNEFLGKMKRKIQSAVSLKTEWSLLVFTLGAPLLFAAFSARVLNRMNFPAWLYIIFGLFCMGVSTSHLGKKRRFFRSIFNWKGSWLSREIIFFSGFFGSSSIILITGFYIPPLLVPVLLLGLMALLSFDRVYLIDSNIFRNRFHETSVFFIGIYLATLFIYVIPLIVTVGVVKLSLFLKRRMGSPIDLQQRWFLILRILFGLLLPAILLTVSAEGFKVFIILSVLLSEILGRTEFYLELEFIRPQTKAYMDLQKMLLSSSSGR